jgi:hypothetical protein
LAGKPTKSSVDSNMSVLRGRIEQVRRVERLTLTDTCGWNYQHNCDIYNKNYAFSPTTKIENVKPLGLGSILEVVGSILNFIVNKK